MDSERFQDEPASTENFSSGEVEAESNNVDSLEVVSSGGDTAHELENTAEILARVELDLACLSEKLINLDILVMHVASRENDFEAFVSEEEGTLEGSVEKALEFDLLYGVLDSEVKELDSFLLSLQTDIISSRRVISSSKQLGDAIKEIEEKLPDCEESLKRSFEQLSDIKMQSANFRRILLSSSGDEKWKDDKELASLENGRPSDINAKIKMQTAEQQRNILRMLEKSLAKEMDLEKKLTESRQNEEGLKLRLQQEVFCMEEEAEDMWQRLFEAENSAEILWGVSKEQFGRNKELERKSFEAGKLAESADAECELLREFNMELNKELTNLKSSIADATVRVEQLERQLKDSEIKRLHAEASAEASQEKQNMLDCTIKDMENLIKDLKSKVLKAKSQTESAEDKCIILSESNAELIEEVNFLRHRVESLETSLHQADEAKKETVKDIQERSKLIIDLVMQLGIERERLHKQILSSKKEKKATLKYLQLIKRSAVTNRDAKVKQPVVSDNDTQNATSRKESNEEIMGSSATSHEIGKMTGESSAAEIEMQHPDPSFDNTVRNLDARQLSWKKYALLAVFFVAQAFVIKKMFSVEGT